jgi:hypothetical protein
MMRRLFSGIPAVGLLSVACVTAPIAYQDGLPAATPAPGTIAARLGYNRQYWWLDGRLQQPDDYFTGGARFGQEWRWLCFEEGLTLVYRNQSPLPCLEGGVGLRSPAVTLRGLWTPVWVGSRTSFALIRWWQVSGLLGTPRNARGLGVSGGARTSRIGIGPIVVLDYAHRDVSLRLEASMTVPTPWANDRVKGNVLTVGLNVEPSRPLPRKKP